MFQGILTFLSTMVHATGWALVIALISIGLTLVFDIMDFFNMVHGIFFMMPIMLLYFLSPLVFNNYLLTGAAAIAIMVLLAIFLEKFVFRRVEGRIGASVILTIALLFIFEQVTLWFSGGQHISFPDPIEISFSLGGVNFAGYDFILIISSLLLLLTFRHFLRNTEYGRNIRAIANNRTQAAVVGINIDRYLTLLFVVCMVLTTTGALLAAPITGAFYTSDIPILILACIVIITGGIGSIKGAVMASFIIVYAEYIALNCVPPTLARATALGIMVAVLVLKPEGISPGEI